MYQIDDPTAVADLPASTAAGLAGYFSDGDPLTGEEATVLPAEFMNMLMMELLNVITGAGITPSKTAFNQLLGAIRALGGIYVAAAGTANALTAAPAVPPAAYQAGLALNVKVLATNTGAVTINVAGLGAKSIRNPDGTVLSAGELIAGMIARLVYDGTNFQLLNSPTGATPVGSDNSNRFATTSWANAQFGNTKVANPINYFMGQM